MPVYVCIYHEGNAMKILFSSVKYSQYHCIFLRALQRSLCVQDRVALAMVETCLEIAFGKQLVSRSMRTSDHWSWQQRYGAAMYAGISVLIQLQECCSHVVR